jgi:hypothetical protein
MAPTIHIGTAKSASTSPVIGIALGRAKFTVHPIHVVPWPKGRVVGPPEAFVTRPADWQNDVDTLLALVERFALLDPNGAWAEHAIFVTMTGHDWGVFCHKHFDHHLRQFGQ